MLMIGNHQRFGSWGAFRDGVRVRVRPVEMIECHEVEQVLFDAHRAMDALGYPPVRHLPPVDNQLTLWGAA